MNSCKRVVGYTRVSTSGQVEDGTGLEIQRVRISEYCEQNGLVLDKIYEDKAMSGTMRDRPALLELLKDVEEDRIKQVIVYRQDRLSREMGLTIFIDNKLTEHGVQLTSVLEPIIDLHDGLSKLIHRMLALFNEWEKDLLASRLSEGRRNNAKNGKRGSGPIPYGYMKVGDDLVANPDESVIVKKIFLWRHKGRRYSEIAKILSKRGVVTKRGGVFGVQAIKCILTNQIYCGETIFGAINTKGIHKSIVSRRLFLKTQTKTKDGQSQSD